MTDDTDTDAEQAAEQADDYERFEINLPVDHPFTALKSHAIQFGVALGVSLAFLAATSQTGLATAALAQLAVILWAIGIDEVPGPADAVDADDSAIGSVQIRRKPHYTTTPMVISFVLTYAALTI